MLSFTRYSAPNAIKECCYMTQIRIKHFVPMSYLISHQTILSKRIRRIQKQLEGSLIMTRNEIFLLTYLTRYKNGTLQKQLVLHRITRMCLRQKKDNTEVTNLNDRWIFDLTVCAQVFLTLYKLLFSKDLCLLSKHRNLILTVYCNNLSISRHWEKESKASML